MIKNEKQNFLSLELLSVKDTNIYWLWCNGCKDDEAIIT